MDAFFASVEQLLHPEYRNKPVIVGAQPGTRGVVSAASYEARTYGVHSAMPISTAYSLCPNGIYLPVNGAIYKDFSKKIIAVLESFSPDVEVASIDEAYLDLTGCPILKSGFDQAGRAVKQAIFDAVSLTASVGIAANKFIAKIASDYKKPDGLMVVEPGSEMEFLKPLGIEKLFGIGKKTVQYIRAHGIRTVAQLQGYDRPHLVRLFGSLGDSLYRYSRGIDHSKVCDESMPKSIGKETTFEKDISDTDYMYAALARLSEDVGGRLRKQSLYASCVTLKVRFGSFKTITRSLSFSPPANEDTTIFSYIKNLFQAVVLAQKIRLLGVTVSKLSTGSQQLDLFAETAEKHHDLYKSLDTIRETFGKRSVTMGTTLANQLKSANK